MRRICFILLALVVFVISEALAQVDCNAGCTFGNWTIKRITYEYPEGFPQAECSIDVDFQYRTVNCGGNISVEFKINWVAAVINNNCPQLDFGQEMLRYANSRILRDPLALTGWTPPPPNQCWDFYQSVGPACWHREWKSGPVGERYYLYPCAEEPVCCKRYTVCSDANGVPLEPTPGAYLPADCHFYGPACQINPCP